MGFLFLHMEIGTNLSEKRTWEQRISNKEVKDIWGRAFLAIRAERENTLM